MARKVKFDYFAGFEKQAEIACEEADLLAKTIAEFTTAENLRGVLEEAHKIEQRGDDANHEILRNVAVDFITPIDREDVIDMAHRMDAVTDNIEGVIQRLFMYDVHQIHDSAPEFADLICKSARALHRAAMGFRDFKNVAKLRELLEEVNTHEEEADELYLATMRKLYTEEHDHAVRVEVWSKVFESMEKSCDACEHVADTMSTVMLKNM